MFHLPEMPSIGEDNYPGGREGAGGPGGQARADQLVMGAEQHERGHPQPRGIPPEREHVRAECLGHQCPRGKKSPSGCKRLDLT